MNAAKLDTHARLPVSASPAAMPTMSDSAMPTLKNRSGYFLPKNSVYVELWTSPSTTTTSGYSPPSASSACPKASRVALPILKFIGVLQEHLFRRDRRERC